MILFCIWDTEWDQFAEVYVLPIEHSCVLSRECDVGDSSLSRKEFCVANKVRSWGSRSRPTSLVSPQNTKSTL